MRILWGIGGSLALCLGIIGAALPLLPTVPFLLLAAFCFSRSSDKWYRWLTTHPVLGPPIRDWNVRQAISRRVKWKASISMLAILILSAVFFDLRLVALQSAVMTAVAVFIWTRSE